MAKQTVTTTKTEVEEYERDHAGEVVKVTRTITVVEEIDPIAGVND